MKKWAVIGTGAIVILIGTFMVANKVSPIGWGWWGAYNASSDIALHGYDPVDYFASDEATQGSGEFSHEWNGVIWHFSSSTNLELFAANPEDYTPEFGGYCAFAVSKGFTADISPDAWHIEAGRLFLFADQGVRDEWVTGLSEGSLEQSVENWSER